MRPLVHRIRLLRPLRPPSRLITHFERSRPQLPFLYPARFRISHIRWLTTERKEWIKSELTIAAKFIIGFWGIAALGTVAIATIVFEILERQFPTPDEWLLRSKYKYKRAKWLAKAEDDDTFGVPPWPRIGAMFRRLVDDLEDPKYYAPGLNTGQDPKGPLEVGEGSQGYDITSKSEPWRRGYHEALMGAAKAAEYLQNDVMEVSTKTVFPLMFVRGPQNPYPVPLPEESGKTAPHIDDCIPASPPPEVYYLRALTTTGFTDKQRLVAAIGCANWYDIQGKHDAATEMLQRALDIAKLSSPNSEKLFDSIGALRPNAGLVSENVLAATKALALHRARTGDLDTALPIFLSLLRARHALPDPAPGSPKHTVVLPPRQGLMDLVSSWFKPHPYPPPPSDGTSPSQRDALDRCEEAGLMSHIGEILYATSTGDGAASVRGKEEGLAWTREGVDVAEEELRTRAFYVVDKEANSACRACLRTGLRNWELMVAGMVKEDEERRGKEKEGKGQGWLSFATGSKASEGKNGRWDAEWVVVEDRARRAKDVLAPPAEGGFIEFLGLEL